MLIAKLMFVITSLALAGGKKTETVEEFLKRFHANPNQTLLSLPARVDENGNAHPRGMMREVPEETRLRERYNIRSEIIQNAEIDFRIAPGANDDAARLIDGGSVTRNLRDLESQRLTRGSSFAVPWDDSYWPIYRGLIAVRYADPQAPESGSWPVNYAYSRDRPAGPIVGSGDATAVGNLSPAEKYDAALGDGSFTLTNYSWDIGRKKWEDGVGIPKWTGICHGWAAAASMGAAYPQRPVVVYSPSGRPIVFYPQDVKALQSMLWANAPPPTRFIGYRCGASNPPRDPNGRVTDPRCFDTNPATWHVAVTNQLGKNRRSFVMDGTYDVEVWNYPLLRYQYAYFNPQTMKSARTLSDAMVRLENFSLDKFRAYRDPRAKAFAGISMDITFVTEINPSHRPPTAEPLVKTFRFIYDLELDENANIIGGEWYSRSHPDFLWNFRSGSQAFAPGDASLANDPWSIGQPVPDGWTPLAQRASARGVPLFSFIKRLANSSSPSVLTDSPLPDPGPGSRCSEESEPNSSSRKGATCTR